MRPLSTTQLQALQSPATIFAVLWRIARTDGVIVRLTDHDTDLVICNELYRAAGLDRTAIRLGDGTTADSVDISGLFGGAAFGIADLQTGVYDYATVVVALAFVDRPDTEPIPLIKGRFGAATVDRGAYRIEINGLQNALRATIGEVTTPTCRVRFGSARCGANIAPGSPYRHTYTVLSTSADRRVVTLSGASQTTGQQTYVNGRLIVTSGAADGTTGDIRSVSWPQVTMYLPLGRVPSAGDNVDLVLGCDYSAATCRDVFNNLANFQGEPSLPGIDALAAPRTE